MNAPDQDPLFDALRERLGGHERPPAPATWDALAAQLQRRRRRRAIGWWFGGGAALLGLAVLLLWLRVAPPAGPVTSRPAAGASVNSLQTRRAGAAAAVVGNRNAPAAAASPARPAAASVPASAESTGPAASANAVVPAASASQDNGSPGGAGATAPTSGVPAPTLVPAPAPAPDSVPPSEEVKLARLRHKSALSAARAARVRANDHDTAARLAAASKKSSGASAKASVAAPTLAGASAAPAAVPKASAGAPTTSAGVAKAAATPPLLAALVPTAPVVKRGAFPANLPAAEFVAADTTRRPITLPGRWAFGFGAGAGLAHRRLGAGSTPLAQAENPGLAGQGQLTVRYTLTPRLALSGGLGYAVYQQRLRTTIVRREQEVRYVFHPATDSLGAGYYAWEYVPLDSTASRTGARRTTALRYLTLPLAVEWSPRVAAVRWRPVIGAGVTVQRLLSGRTPRLNAQCDCETTAENLRPWALGLTAAGGVDYALRPDFWLQLRPTATYLLTPATRGAAPARHPFGATVQVGLRWTPPRRPAARP